MSPVPPATILASAAGLGVYIPAIVMRQGLAGKGVVADVEVVEGYFLPEKQRALVASRAAQQQNFALAKIANRMARGVADCFDASRVDRLFDTWAEQGRHRFVVWSGFWLPLIEAYRSRCGFGLHVDHCHIDADVSASFKLHASLRHQGRDVWLWNWQRRELPYRIAVGETEVERYADREQALVVHGGGWGLGGYLDTLPELAHTEYALHVVGPGQGAGRARRREGDRLFALKPHWEAWMRDEAGNHVFPPMMELSAAGEWMPMADTGHHAMHGVIRRSKAIVSKPGGCTLIDSLASATPVVLLDAYSASEARNAQVWRELGYGIAFDDWRKTGFSAEAIEPLHSRLMAARRQGIDYIHALAEESLRREVKG
jgi:hypothetical protein